MNLLEKIQAYFKEEGLNLEVSETNLAEAVLEDGTTKIYSKAEEWAAGVDIFILNEENEEIPLPIGEYKLEDGTMVVVEEVGIVASVGAVEEEVEASEEPSTKDVLDLIHSQIGELKENFNKQIEEVKKDNTRLSKTVEDKDSQIEELKAEFKHEGLPRGEAKKEEKKQIDLSKLTPKERILAIQENLNK